MLGLTVGRRCPSSTMRRSVLSPQKFSGGVLPPKHSAQECLMEGIVVQPLVERTHPEIGRVVLKLISDRYLLRKDGTELHDLAS